GGSRGRSASVRIEAPGIAPSAPIQIRTLPTFLTGRQADERATFMSVRRLIYEDETVHTTNRTHIAWIDIGRLFQAFTRHQLHTPDRFRYKRDIAQPAQIVSRRFGR